MKLSKIMAIALAVACLLTGCWQEEPPEEPEDALPPFEAEEPEKQKDSVLPERFALPYMPGRTLDPMDCADGMQQTAGSLLYEGLFRLDGSFEPQPCLCISYTHDEAALRYTFELRPGVEFSDGSPLTGRDVKASLERARTSDRYRSRLSGVASVSANGDSVTVTLNSPNSALPALLDVPVVKSGTQESAAPVGTGPYFYAEEETGAYLIANQAWWKGESQPVDRIALVEAADDDAMLYRFSSHEVQLITADLTGVRPGWPTGPRGGADADTPVMQYIGCNTARAPLDSPALRRALSAGIERGNVAGAYLSGHGKPAAFPVSPVSSLYPAALEEDYSVDGFTAAVAESGYVPERPLTLLVNEENGFKKAIAAHLAESWTAGGVAVEVRAELRPLVQPGHQPPPGGAGGGPGPDGGHAGPVRPFEGPGPHPAGVLQVHLRADPGEGGGGPGPHGGGALLCLGTVRNPSERGRRGRACGTAGFLKVRKPKTAGKGGFRFFCITL